MNENVERLMQALVSVSEGSAGRKGGGRRPHALDKAARLLPY